MSGAGKRWTYVRPMGAWWRRDPYYVLYMIREVTSLTVLAYALVLLVGAVRLAQGEAAWNGWLAALASPWSIAFHAVLLAGMVFHAWSWFEIMPKTLPFLYIGGRRVAAATVSRAGYAIAVVATLLVWALAWVLGP